MNPNDERSKLIFTFLDIVERVRPKAFVMENVKALGVLEKWESVRRKYFEFMLWVITACHLLCYRIWSFTKERERILHWHKK